MKPIRIKEGNKERLIYIAGADQMEREELKDIVQWQEEKTRAELREEVTVQRKHSEKEVGEALKDFNEHRKRAREGNKKYF